MEKASALNDLIQVFCPEALDFETMGKFYCDKTMSVRTGDEYDSPTEHIFDAILFGMDSVKYLFMGHKGCGKSTELNKLKRDLANEGYHVVVIQTALEIDMQNISYIDLLILIADRLIRIAKDVDYDIEGKLLKSIEGYWNETEIVKSETSLESAEVATEAHLGLLTPIINLFAKGIAEIKYSSDNSKKVRERFEQRSSEWIQIIRALSMGIANKCEGKYPVLIFEDLDKLDPRSAWSLFYERAATLSALPFHVVYTFPISLSYRLEFGGLEGYFAKESLPMIKLRTKDNERFEKGFQLVKGIVLLRASEDLFDEEALEEMIMKTGGSLRDLFNVIVVAGLRAYKRNAKQVEMEDAKHALMKLRSDLTKRIEVKQYDSLKNIYENKDNIQDREDLVAFMQSSVVLEYNGKRWHDLHPLIIDFLKEQGIL